MKKFVGIVILSLFTVKVYGVSELKINGATSATVATGEAFTITFSFGSGSSTAKGIVYLDVNENGQWDQDDQWLWKYKLIDGACEDEAGAGAYKEVCTPIIFSGKYLFRVEDAGGAEAVPLTVNKLNSQFSVSGKVDPPAKANVLVTLIIVIDANAGKFACGYGDFTDGAGNYEISIPPELGNRFWKMAAIDPAMVVLDYASNDPVNDSVKISGAETKNLAMCKVVSGATTIIRGTLRDPTGAQVINDPVTIMGMSIIGYQFSRALRLWRTDEKGRYQIPLPKGTPWGYGVSSSIVDQFKCELMNPVNVSKYTPVGLPVDECTLNLTSYKTNATISGKVYKDGSPYFKCKVWAIDILERGSNYSRVCADGSYTICVSSALQEYKVVIASEYIPQGGQVSPLEHRVKPGATGVDFNVTAVEEVDKVQSLSLTVQPNPFLHSTVFRLSGTTDAGNLVLYNISGRYVAEIEPEPKDGGTSYTVANQLQTGVYFYHLTAGNSVFKGKVIKLQ